MVKKRYWVYGGIIGVIVTYILFLFQEYVYSFSFIGMFAPLAINQTVYDLLYWLSYILSFFIGGLIGSVYGRSKNSKGKRKR